MSYSQKHSPRHDAPSGRDTASGRTSSGPRRDASVRRTSSAPRTTRPTARAAADAKKKKTLVIVIVAVLLVIIAVSLVFILIPKPGSGQNGTSANGNNPRQSGNTIVSEYYKNGVLPTAGERHDIKTIDNGGSESSQLTGKWKLDQTTTYVFDGEGRGIMLTGVDNYTFVYSAQNGKLAIDFDTDKGADYEYEYSISGDTLSMTRSDRSFTMTKVQ